MTAPPFPDGLLLQSLLVDGEGESAGFRIWQDGRHETLAHGTAWAPARSLDAGQLAAVRAALADADLAPLAGSHGLAHHVAGRRWLQAALADGTIELELAPGTELPPVERLTAQVVLIAAPGAIPPELLPPAG